MVARASKDKRRYSVSQKQSQGISLETSRSLRKSWIFSFFSFIIIKIFEEVYQYFSNILRADVFQDSS